MKFILATFAAAAAAFDEPLDMHYDNIEEHGHLPHGDFDYEVFDFNPWHEIWSQNEYEERVHTEAELMVSLEGLRESLVHLDHEIDDLQDCIDDNHSDIDENNDDILWNHEEITENQMELDDQQ